MSENTSIEVNAADPSIEVEGFVVVGPSPFGDHNHDHGELTGLTDPDHPIAAVQGLQTALNGKETAGAAASSMSAHTAASDPHTGYQRESEKAAANGYASLDATTKVPFAQLPTGTSASQVAIGNHSHTGTGHTIEDEGVALTQRTALNFTGAGVTATDAGGKTVVTIPGGGGGGVTDHGALTGLTDPDHPIAAVQGLQAALDGAIPASLADAKGDLLVATADNTVGRLAVGATTGHVLTVDPAEASGVKWAAAAGGSPLTLKANGSDFTTAATSIDFAGYGVTASDPTADQAVVRIGGPYPKYASSGVVYYPHVSGESASFGTYERAYFVPFNAPASCNLTQIVARKDAGGASGVMRCGIFTTDGTTLDLLQDFGTAAATGTGNAAWSNLGRAITYGTRYFIGLVAQGNSAVKFRGTQQAQPAISDGRIIGSPNPSAVYYEDTVTGAFNAQYYAPYYSQVTPQHPSFYFYLSAT